MLTCIYYHGTTDALGNLRRIAPPTETAILSESRRKKNLDKVFFTMDPRSALIYARKAVKRFGGAPVIYDVYPEGEVTELQGKPGTTVYMADGARVISRLKYIP